MARVLLLTALTALGWLLIDPSRAFAAAIAVLVVACPCAFALTAPATLIRAFGVLAGRGVLVTDAAALARLARVDLAMFDKTGTLGVPQLDRRAIEPLRGDSPEQMLQLAAALAHESSHPLARALADTARDTACRRARRRCRSAPVPASAARSMAARCVWVGRISRWLPAASRFRPRSADALLLADDQGALAAFHLDEQPRADARRTLDALRTDGVTTMIASGDTAARVAALAGSLGVDDWHAGQTPTDKLARLRAARAGGHVVLAVGDGSNDAPLLAGADVSAVLASGTELAQSHADLLLLDGRLDGLVSARATACQVQQVMQQSRRWALVYNLCAVPFAAFGLVPPWLAAIGMSLSSLFVVLHRAARARRRRTRASRGIASAFRLARGRGMNILLVLIPVTLLVIAIAVALFFWAVNHQQFDDLETPARIAAAG